MKRCKNLAWLSRQHHTALVLAKRMQRSSQHNTEVTRELMSHAVKAFEQELEPHFQVEEQVLLPLMATEAESGRVSRTLAEHEELRRLANRLRTQDETALHPFGDALQAHIRFEERELFPAAEAALTPEALAILEMHDLTTTGA